MGGELVTKAEAEAELLEATGSSAAADTEAVLESNPLTAAFAVSVTVDLPSQRVSWAGQEVAFEIEPDRKRKLLQGLDEIGLTLQHADAIRAYEARRRTQTPWLFE